MSAATPGLGARMECAAEMLSGWEHPPVCVADIGCDHGRLACALLERRACERVIAADVSAPSLHKAELLMEKRGLTDRCDLRLGDGLGVLQPGEADAVCLLGMGGTLIARLLSEHSPAALGVSRLVMQPMRGEEDLRSYLYENGYRIAEDRVVKERGRYYQVLSAILPGDIPEREPLPEFFPEGHFLLGYRAFENRDPLLPELAQRKLGQCMKRLETARGTAGEPVLQRQREELEQILRILNGTDSAAAGGGCGGKEKRK